jgi:hypothetical protein
MSEKKFEGWDEIEKEETVKKIEQKSQAFDEWDNLLDNNKSNDGFQESELSVIKSASVNTTGITTQNSKTWGVIGAIGFALVFIFIIIPLFSGGGSKTLTSGSGYKVVGSVNLYGDGAFIDADLKVTQSGAYQVNVSIYSSSGQYLGSNNQIYYLSAGDEASVYFYIPNIMSSAKPTKYSVSVTKG